MGWAFIYAFRESQILSPAMQYTYLLAAPERLVLGERQAGWMLNLSWNRVDITMNHFPQQIHPSTMEILLIQIRKMVGMQPEDNCCKAHHSCPNVSENELGFSETGLMHRCMSQVAELLSSLLHLKKIIFIQKLFCLLTKNNWNHVGFQNCPDQIRHEVLTHK